MYPLAQCIVLACEVDVLVTRRGLKELRKCGNFPALKSSTGVFDLFEVFQPSKWPGFSGRSSLTMSLVNASAPIRKCSLQRYECLFILRQGMAKFRNKLLQIVCRAVCFQFWRNGRVPGNCFNSIPLQPFYKLLRAR